MSALADSDTFYQAAASTADFDRELEASAGQVTALLAKIDTLRNKGLFGAKVRTNDRPSPPDPDPFTTVSADLLTPARSPNELGWIGNICVKSKIGHGGMGVVYRAEDTDLKREVAVKAILPKYAHNKKYRTRFLREARGVAAVQHSNIVAIYQVGENNGYPFIVMPFLQGLSLQDRLRPAQPLPTEEVVRIAKQVALGLAAAHERGLIHRDIKPSNIWLEEGSQGAVKILDFGLASLPEMLLDPTDHPTKDGTILGTPEYMSPEQARGKRVDYRADLYSLGVLLYRLTTGHLPFAAESAHGYLVAHTAEKPQDARTRNPAIPAYLGLIIMQLLEKDPARRPESAQAVAIALDSHQAVSKTTGRRSPRQALTLAVAAAMILALVGMWRFWPSWSDSNGAAPVPPKQQPLVTTLLRPDAKLRIIQTPKELAGLVPLRLGDELELSCEVPKGYKAALFMVDTTGQLRELTQVQATTVGGFDRIRFPAPGIWRVEGPPGTVLFLGCANRQARPLLEDWQHLLQVTGDGRSPLLAPNVAFLFVMDNDDVEAFGEISRDVVENLYSRLRDQLRELRTGALEKFDYVWGAAMPVR